jgi:Icc-related predicted phosphoesterase
MDENRNHTIVVISDTHCQHGGLYIPTCDFLIHCGDFTHIGRKNEVEEFVNWFSAQSQATYRICVAGNHEFALDIGHKYYNAEVAGAFHAAVAKDPFMHYLENQSIVLDGIKFFGSPYSSRFGDWGFGVSEQEMAAMCDMIPEDTDIVITHGPAHMMRDWVPYRGGVNTGSNVLADRLGRLHVNLHLCGHIHPSRGFACKNQTLHVNAACVNDNHELEPGVVVIEIEAGKVTDYDIKFTD